MIWANPHVRGHFLQFDRSPDRTSSTTSTRLLLCALLLEGVRIAVTVLLPPEDIGVTRGTIVGPLSLAAAITAIVALGPSVPRELGLRSWDDWSPTERSYGVQVALLATLVFVLILGAPSGPRWLLVFLPYLCFGAYQELVYRGLLQTALARRWNGWAAIVVANLLYTFGPLHWNYLTESTRAAVTLFAATFAIGLYFGVLYHRSGNLWLPAVFHAIGNAFIVSRLGRGG